MPPNQCQRQNTSLKSIDKCSALVWNSFDHISRIIQHILHQISSLVRTSTH